MQYDMAKDFGMKKKYTHKYRRQHQAPEAKQLNVNYLQQNDG